MAWWPSAAPRNCGIRRKVTPDTDAPLIAALLSDGRSLEQLQRLATELWAIKADADPRSTRSWIAGGNRSIHVMHHVVEFLELGLKRRAAASTTPAAPAFCRLCNNTGWILGANNTPERFCECREGATRVS